MFIIDDEQNIDKFNSKNENDYEDNYTRWIIRISVIVVILYFVSLVIYFIF